MSHVTILRAWEDNYIYLFQYAGNQAAVVDPADDEVVLRALQAADLELTHVLVTHHHRDHIAGVEALQQKTGCQIVGPDRQRIPQVSHLVGQGDHLRLGSIRVEVIATPGHTRTSVCYYAPPGAGNPGGYLWTGDTLFMGGCGRLFECSAGEMWASLQKISCLPETVKIYGGHDYAEENYRFALSIEPQNQATQQRLQAILNPALASRGPEPTTLAQEKQSNIFLRSVCPELPPALGMPASEAAQVFAELRARKDRF